MHGGAGRSDGGVSSYMAFMWAIPITLMLWCCPGTGEPSRAELARAAFVSVASNHPYHL